jgi:thymidine kinase
VAELLYFTGPMDCGKSTLALQFDHTQAAGGRLGRLFTSQDRSGEATISSRLGLARPAVEVATEFDFWAYVRDQLTAGERIDYLVCDESQFYTAEQVDQLARVVDDLGIDVLAVGIATDFRTRLFPGSQRLIELCDRIEILQVRALCWCGAVATHNARTVDGVMVLEGAQVAVGDIRGDADEEAAEPPVVSLDALAIDGEERPARAAYEVLCRRHHRAHLTRAIAQAGRPDPLPFGRGYDREP